MSDQEERSAAPRDDSAAPPPGLPLWAQILIVCALVAGAAAFWRLQQTSVDAAAAVATKAAIAPPAKAGLVLTQAQVANLTTALVDQRMFYDEITTEGKISVDEYSATPVYSPYPGRVVQIFGRSGERIKKGQPLFSIQANEMVQAQNDFLAALNVLNKSRSQLSLAQNVEKRLRELYELRSTTLKEYQVAQNDLATAQNDQKTAEVGVEAVRNRLRILGKEDTEITVLQQKGVLSSETMINAPLDGTIIQRKIGPGQYVSNAGGDPPYTIGDLSRVWLIANLRETDAAKVDLGERLKFRVLAYPDRIFDGSVNFISAAVDPNTRRILVRADIDNSAGLLKPEMFASVKIINDHETVSLAVPRSAVIYDGDSATVWLLRDDNTVASRRIRPGIVNGAHLEALDGLAVGDRVIVKGSLFVDQAADPN